MTAQVQEKFIRSFMARIELILIHLHAVEQVLIQKGLVTEKEFLSYISESTSLPNKNLGMQIIKEMLKSKEGELSIQDIGTKVLKEMLAEMQEKGDSNAEKPVEPVRKNRG